MSAASGSSPKRKSNWPHMDRLCFLDGVPVAKATRTSIKRPLQARESRKVGVQDGWLVREAQSGLAKAKGGQLIKEWEEFDEEDTAVEKRMVGKARESVVYDVELQSFDMEESVEYNDEEVEIYNYEEAEVC